MQRKYLQRLYEIYGTIKLSIGPSQGFSLQAVFQPLKLCQTATDVNGDIIEDGYRAQDDTIFDQGTQDLPQGRHSREKHF